MSTVPASTPALLATSGLYFDLRIDYAIRRIAIHGEFDASTAPCLATAVIGLQRSTRGTISIALDAVTFMDAAGLGALVGARTAQRDRGDDLIVTGATDAVTRLIVLSGLTELLVGGRALIGSPAASVLGQPLYDVANGWTRETWSG